MNTQDKIQAMNKFIHHIDSYSQYKSHHKQPIHSLKPENVNADQLPSLQLVGGLISYNKEITQSLYHTYHNVETVLKELKKFKNRKENVNLLLDSMTAIKAVRNISFNGLGQSPSSVYKNLSIYYSIVSKVYYCDKYKQKIEESILKIQSEYKNNLNSELINSDSENICDIAKVLNLIHKQSKFLSVSSNQQLGEFYLEIFKKDLQKISNDLFTIPIIGNQNQYTEHPYRFFELIKIGQLSLVKVISTYKINILKISEEEGLHVVIRMLYKYLMEDTLIQVLNRLKKYFEVDVIDRTKISKNVKIKIQHYINEFYAIWNQVQRLKQHIFGEISSTYEGYCSFENDIRNIVNSQPLLQVSSEVIQLVQAVSRYNFNKLLQNSPFSSSIWNSEEAFLQKIDKERQVYECSEGNEFLENTLNIFCKPLKQSLDTYNILIISPILSFITHNLLEQDFYHAFSQLFNKCIEKSSTSNLNSYTLITLLLNCLFVLPNVLKDYFLAIDIPPELSSHSKRLFAQLQELTSTCQYKTKTEMNKYIHIIVSSDWVKTQLINHYQVFINRWKGLQNQISQIFLNEISKIHASLIMEQQFLSKSKKKNYTQNTIIQLDKEVRGQVINFYTKKGSVVYDNFSKIILYIEILLAQNSQSCEELIKKFNISDEAQLSNIWRVRNLKIN